MSELRDGDAPSDFHENLWTLGIKDHKDQPVEIAWVLRDSAECSSIRLSLPFQVYILNTAPKTGAYAKLPELLARWMDWVDVFRTSKNCKCHFEIYRTSFINILACVEHQRQEIEHRNSKDGWSRLVEDWAAIRSYSRSCRGCPWNMGFILVIDRDDWTAEGVLQVKFAQTPNSATFPNHQDRCFDSGTHSAALATRDRNKKGGRGLFRSLRDRCRHFETEVWRNAHVQENADHDNQGSNNQPDDNEPDDSGYSDELKAYLQLQQGMAERSRKINDASFKTECALSRTALLTNSQLPGITITNHFDDIGWPVSHVWDNRHNERKPELSFTLYVANDASSVSPQALYKLLRQISPKDSSWSLDIVWQMDTMSTAMQHYSQEAHRWPSRRAKARHRLIVLRERTFRCAVGRILPEEILQNIVDLSQPRNPAKEDLDSISADWRHVFMYVDGKTLGSGPQIVISDPRVLQNTTMTADMEEQRLSEMPWFSYGIGDTDTALAVTHWRSWATVSDRLHTLSSLRASRCTDFEEDDLPYFSIEVEMPAELHFAEYGQNEPYYICMEASLTLHNCAQPVTVHAPVLPMFFSFDFLVVTDNETNQELDTTCRPHFEDSEDRPLTFQLDYRIGWSCISSLWTFNVGEPNGIDTYVDVNKWWYSLLANNELVDGRSYRVGVSDGLKLPQWTFGARNDLKGPFNLPPIRVEAGRGPSFVYRGP